MFIKIQADLELELKKCTRIRENDIKVLIDESAYS